MSIKDLLNELANMSPEERQQLKELLGAETTPEPSVQNQKVGRRNRKGTAASGGHGGSPPINKFEQSDLFNAFQDDIERDKKLWGDKQPEPRRKKAKLVKVKCNACQRECEVDPSLVFVMSKDEYSYKCDRCQGRRSR